MPEYKLKLKAVAPMAIFGLFTFSSTGIEVVEAKSGADAISKVNKEFDKQLKKRGLEGRALVEVLEIERFDA